MEAASEPRLEPAASRAVLLHMSHANVSISHRQVSWKSIFKCINIYALIYKMLRQSFFVEMLAGARSPPRRTQSPQEEAPLPGKWGRPAKHAAVGRMARWRPLPHLPASAIRLGASFVGTVLFAGTETVNHVEDFLQVPPRQTHGKQLNPRKTAALS